MVSSAIPIITFRYYPYKRKKLTFWVSLNPEEYANSANEPNMNQNHPEKQILSRQTKDVNLGINQDLWEIL